MWHLLVLFRLSAAIAPVQDNEIRETRALDGLWTFVREVTNAGDVGINKKWNVIDLSTFKASFLTNATVMPVPSSYNDLGDAELRDHVGWVWYQKKEIVPKRHSSQRIFIRIDSANYRSKVFINSIEVGEHIGGHLPFEFEITKNIKFDKPNLITVAVNNTLSWLTIPNADFNYRVQKDNISGIEVDRYPEGYFVMKGTFDFFNYAGLLRPVRLLFKPKVFVNDYWINAHANGTFAYNFTIEGANGNSVLIVEVRNAKGKLIYAKNGTLADTRIKNPQLWWPRGLGAPYLYELTARITDKQGNTQDLIRTKFGFRTVTFDKNRIYWNGKPFYCQGFGMHEESDIRGRSYDTVIMTKDLNTFEWTNANCYRTSHYPYAEERMVESDRRGIAVIVETPAAALKSFKNVDLHKQMVVEMITRDRNHPSVFMWSMANEPHTDRPETTKYFDAVIKQARELNIPGLPITTVYGPTNAANDLTADLVDVICINRYYGWYIDTGRLDQIERSLVQEVETWKQRFNKPLMITEYGAESIPGLEREPSVMFTEDYQVELFNRTHLAIDKLIQQHNVAGELAWVFADFMTPMEQTRVVGNHKGLFTRLREPKKAAFTIKDRYAKRFNQRR